MFIELLKYQNVANAADRSGMIKVASVADSKIDRMTNFINNLYKLDLTEYDKQRLLMSKNIFQQFKKAQGYIDDNYDTDGYKSDADSRKDVGNQDVYNFEYEDQYPWLGNENVNKNLVTTLSASILLANNKKLRERPNRYNLPVEMYNIGDKNVLENLSSEEAPVLYDLILISQGGIPRYISRKPEFSVSQSEAKEIIEYLKSPSNRNNFPGMVFSAFVQVVKMAAPNSGRPATELFYDPYISKLSEDEANSEYMTRMYPIISKLYHNNSVGNDESIGGQSRYLANIAKSYGIRSLDPVDAEDSFFLFPKKNSDEIDDLLSTEDGTADFSGLIAKIFNTGKKSMIASAKHGQAGGEKGGHKEVPYLERNIFSSNYAVARSLAIKFNEKIAETGSEEEAIEWMRNHWDFTDLDSSPFVHKSRVDTWFSVGKVKENALKAVVESERKKKKANKGFKYNRILADEELSFDQISKYYKSIGMLDRFFNYEIERKKKNIELSTARKFLLKYKRIKAKASELAQEKLAREMDFDFTSDWESLDPDRVKMMYKELEKEEKKQFDLLSEGLYQEDEAQEYFKSSAENMRFAVPAIRKPNDNDEGGKLGIIPSAASESAKNSAKRQQNILRIFNIMEPYYDDKSHFLDTESAIAAVKKKVNVPEILAKVLPLFLLATEFVSYDQAVQAAGKEGESYERGIADIKQVAPGNINNNGDMDIDTIIKSDFFDEVVKAVMLKIGASNKIGRKIGLVEVANGEMADEKKQEAIYSAFKQALISYAEENRGAFSIASVVNDDEESISEKNKRQRALWTTDYYVSFVEKNLDGKEVEVKKSTVGIFENYIKNTSNENEEAYFGSPDDNDYGELVDSFDTNIYSIRDLKRAKELGIDPDIYIIEKRERDIDRNPDLKERLVVKEAMKKLITSPVIDLKIRNYASSGGDLRELTKYKNNAKITNYNTGRLAAYLSYVCGLTPNAVGLLIMENRANLPKRIDMYFDFVYGIVREEAESIMGIAGRSEKSHGLENSNDENGLLDFHSLEEVRDVAKKISKSGKNISFLSNSPGNNDVDFAIFLASKQVSDPNFRGGIATNFIKDLGFSKNRMKAFYTMRIKQFLDAFRNGVFTTAFALSDSVNKFNPAKGAVGEYFGKNFPVIDKYIAKMDNAISIWDKRSSEFKKEKGRELTDDEAVDIFIKIIEEIRLDFEKECEKYLSVYNENIRKMEYSSGMLAKQYSAAGYKPPTAISPENSIMIFNDFKEYIAKRYGGEFGENIYSVEEEALKGRLSDEIVTEISEIPNEDNSEVKPLLPFIHEKIREFCNKYAEQYSYIGNKGYEGCSEVLRRYYETTGERAEADKLTRQEGESNNDIKTESDSAEVESDSAEVEPDSAEVEPDSAEVEPGSAEVEPDSVGTESDSVGTESDSVGTESDSAGTESVSELPTHPVSRGIEKKQFINEGSWGKNELFMNILEALNKGDTIGRESVDNIVPNSNIFNALTQDLDFSTDGSPSPNGSLKLNEDNDNYSIVYYPQWYLTYLKNKNQGMTQAENERSMVLEALSMCDIEVEMMLKRYGF